MIVCVHCESPADVPTNIHEHVAILAQGFPGGGAAARAVPKNKGFARRPQEFLGLGAGSWEEVWRYGGMEV